MALSRVKTWTAEELTSSDLNAEFNNILNNATSLISPLVANLSAGGFRLIGLSAGSAGSPALQPTGDTDTGVYFPAANQVGVVAGGTAVVTVTGGTGGVNAILSGLAIAPAYTEAASGTHAIESSLYVAAPTITGGVATATNGATVYIAGPTAGTVTGANYSLWVAAGNARFEDEVYFGANQITLTDKVDASKILITSQASGDILYASSGTAWSRLAKGTDGYSLYLSGGVPVWGGGMPIGAVTAYAGTTAPTGWLLCWGQAVAQASYPALYAILGTTYGADTGGDFIIPDLRGRVIAGQDDMGGTSANRMTAAAGGIDGDTLGDAGGAETTSDVVAHTHTYGAVASGTGLAGGTDYQVGSDNTGSTGNASVPIMQPTIVLNYIIRAL